MNDSVTYLHNIKTDNPELYDQNIKAKLTKILNFNENSILKSLLGQDGEERNGNDKPAAPDSNKLDFIVDMFLKLFVEFHAMSIHISKEFVDSHTVHRRDSQKLVFPDSLKNYILNSDLSSEEKEQRIKLLWNEIEELILN